MWLKNFLMDLEVVPTAQSAITLYYDNSRAVANAKEPRSHKRGKYIERKHHLLREIVHRGDVKVSQIASEDNLADLLQRARHKGSLINMWKEWESVT